MGEFSDQTSQGEGLFGTILEVDLIYPKPYFTGTYLFLFNILKQI